MLGVLPEDGRGRRPGRPATPRPAARGRACGHAILECRGEENVDVVVCAGVEPGGRVVRAREAGHCDVIERARVAVRIEAFEHQVDLGDGLS